MPWLDAIAAAAIPNLSVFDAQNIAITAWAYSTLAVFNETLIEAISAEAIRRIGECGPQSLANLALSCARLK